MGEVLDLGDVLEEAVALITSEESNVDRVYEEDDVLAEVGSL